VLKRLPQAQIPIAKPKQEMCYRACKIKRFNNNNFWDVTPCSLVDTGVSVERPASNYTIYRVLSGIRKYLHGVTHLKTVAFIVCTLSRIYLTFYTYGQLNNITRNRVMMSTRYHNTHDTHALTVHEQHITTYEVLTSSQPNAAQRIPHYNKYFMKF
jgi:hypothetical protein